MNTALKVVVIEDSDDDARLLIRELKRAGWTVEWCQVQNEGELRDTLSTGSWDLIIADNSLPRFNAMAAMVMAPERSWDGPFIVVSGKVGEETAVEAMRAGASDFVAKANISRLATVAERELRNARERRNWSDVAAGPIRKPSEPVPLSWEWFLPLALATSLTLGVTVLIEVLIEWFLPLLPSWESALLTLALAAPVAAGSLYYLLQRRRALMQRMMAQFVEHRRLNDVRHRLADRTRELEANLQERLRREQHTKAQHQATRMMAANSRLEIGLPALMESLCATLDWDLGEVWLRETAEAPLQCVTRFPAAAARTDDSSHDPDLLPPEWVHTPFTQGRSMWIASVRELDEMHRSMGGSILTVPIRLREETLGVIVLQSREAREMDKSLMAVGEDVGIQVGQFVERCRVQSVLQNAREDLEERVQRRTSELASVNDALSRSEANLRQAQQIARLGSFETRVPFDLAQGNYWSEEACRILGIEPIPAGLSVSEFLVRWVHPDDRTHLQRALSVVESEGGTVECDLRIVRPDGAVRFVRILGEPSVKSGGQIRTLVGTLQDVTERKELEQQVLEVSENEQRRIGEDLHDDLCQHLAGIEFMNQALHDRLLPHRPEDAELAKNLGDLVRDAIQRTRGLARGLSPVQLESRGLPAALADLVVNVQRLFQIECVFHASADVKLANITTATHIYRIAQEAINNALRHGKATRIEIELQRQGDLAALHIRDDGIGFTGQGESHTKGMGLRIMHHRASMIGASLQVMAGPERGVVVSCTRIRC